VEDAWIFFTLEAHTKNIAGGGTTYLRVEPPHTRTDEKGRFLMPAQRFKKPLSLYEFGFKADRWGITANTIDDREGGYGIDLRNDFKKGLRNFGTKGFDLNDSLLKKKVEMTILIRPREDINDNEEYFAYLSGLYSYCFSGRSLLEVPPVAGGCDDWEINYIIAKRERFLKRLVEPRTIGNETYYALTLKGLGYLHERKKDYTKALNTFMKVKDFDEKRGVNLFLREYQEKINELQKLIPP
jgi:tetratricopeptide (TPR) repeat protein